MAGSDQKHGFAILIQEFASDSAQLKLELPKTLSVEERKQAKQLVDTYPGLMCESFGFGAERQLHVFKKTPAEPSVRVRNTFIDDWVVSQDGEADGPQFRSMPTALFSRTSDSNKIHQGPKVISLAPPAELAESSPLNITSGPRSPPQEPPTIPTPMPIVPDGFTYAVRDTFIHIDCDQGAASEERAFKSMPHGLFTSHMEAELASAQAPVVESTFQFTPPFASSQAPVIESSFQFPPPTPPSSPPWGSFSAHPGQEPLPTGTEVIIQGLTKLTAFNGQAGTIQEYDPQTERYKIILNASAAGHRMAKVKLDNLRSNMPPPPPLHHANAPTLLSSTQEMGCFDAKPPLLSTGPATATASAMPVSAGAPADASGSRSVTSVAFSLVASPGQPLSLDGLV